MKILMTALATLLMFLAPREATADDQAPGHAHVYLGQIDQGGTWLGRRFEQLPSVTYAEQAQIKVDHASIVCIAGAKLRAERGPNAKVIGRLAARSRVHLVGMRIGHGYVWGEVDTSGVKVMAGKVCTYACNGFTGRSGASPISTGVRASVASRARPAAHPAAAPFSRVKG
jgi:hypothetical protein